jgi:hypothetical protein
MLYLVCITLIGSMMIWSSMLSNASSGRGSGNSWFSPIWFGGGYGGGHSGGFAGSVGGGHK